MSNSEEARQTLGLQRAMATAFPDWSFQARHFAEHGDTVTAKVSVGRGS
jgi:hypothetical protein